MSFIGDESGNFMASTNKIIVADTMMDLSKKSRVKSEFSDIMETEF